MNLNFLKRNKEEDTRIAKVIKFAFELGLKPVVKGSGLNTSISFGTNNIQEVQEEVQEEELGGELPEEETEEEEEVEEDLPDDIPPEEEIEEYHPKKIEAVPAA